MAVSGPGYGHGMTTDELTHDSDGRHDFDFFFLVFDHNHRHHYGRADTE